MKHFFLLCLLLLSACASQKSSSPELGGDSADKEAEKLLYQGYQFIVEKQPRKGIDTLEEAMKFCQYQYNSKEKKYYAARGTTDTLYYMMKAASQNKPAVAVKNTCADVLFYIAYAYYELGHLSFAEKYVVRALEMSPVNSMYLSELGHIYQTQKLFDKAMEVYKKAESAAEGFSPESEKITELTRAKRGVGFILIERGQLDEAEKKYKECLALDANDQTSINELKYINSLKLNDLRNQ